MEYPKSSSSFQADVHAFVKMLSLGELNPGITEEVFLDFLNCSTWKKERMGLQEINHRSTQASEPR